MFSTASNVDTASSQFNKEEDIDGFEPQGFDCEKVTRQHLFLIMMQEGELGVLRLSLRGWSKAMSLKQIANGRAVDGVAEFDQFPFDAVITPSRVLTGELKH